MNGTTLVTNFKAVAEFPQYYAIIGALNNELRCRIASIRVVRR